MKTFEVKFQTVQSTAVITMKQIVNEADTEGGLPPCVVALKKVTEYFNVKTVKQIKEIPNETLV